MNKLFSIALTLLVSLSAAAAFAQPATGSATFSGGAASNAMSTNENLSVHGGGVGIGRATEECVTSRTYLNGVVASGTDCVFRPSTLKQDTAPCAKIVQVVRKGACTAAAEYLASLRRGTESYEYFTVSFRKELAVAGLTLEDFKMSESKLRELQVFGAKLSATKYLVQLRKGTSSYEYFMRSLREELKAGGLTPADIGSSEFELADIRQSKN